MRRVTVCLVLMLASLAIAHAETYVVNPEGTGDFPTIQAAIAAALDGDIIELTDGTFTGDGNRDVDFLGKMITVRSQSGDPETCIIDCEGSPSDPHRGFIMHSQKDLSAVLMGVTITGGYAPGDGFGGGLYCEWVSPRIINCVFAENYAAEGAGAYLFDNCFPAFIDCQFRNNTAAHHGGAVHCFQYVAVRFEDCVFESNSAGQEGGAIRCIYLCAPTLTRCTLANNTAEDGGAIYGNYYCGAALDHCTLVFNSAPSGGGIWGEYSRPTLENTIIAFGSQGQAIRSNLTGTLSCCDLYGNAGGDWVGNIADQLGLNGNISEDPLFCDPDNGDFHLDCNSPCAPFSPPNPECDLIGAWPVGCGSSPVTKDSWGGVKALFR